MPRMLGIRNRPDLIDDVIVPPESYGVRLISMGFFASEDQAVIWRGPMLHKALEQFLTDVHWGDPDYLLIDMPPGTGDVVALDGAVPAACRGDHRHHAAARGPAGRAAGRGDGREGRARRSIGVIENMAWFTGDDGKRYELFGSGGGARARRPARTCRCSARCRSSRRCARVATTGAPIVVAHPDDEAAVAFRAIAERWIG